MELIEGLDPEDARRPIDPALQHMMNAVHQYEGYVAQSMGDGIFALFGVPLAHEDHAQRAIYAGLRMQAEIGEYADRHRLAGGMPIEIRVGINTGEVVVSQHTHRLTDGYFQFNALGAATIKGVSVSVHIYEVVGVESGRNRLQIAALVDYQAPVRAWILDKERDSRECQIMAHLFREKYSWGDGLPVALEPAAALVELD